MKKKSDINVINKILSVIYEPFELFEKEIYTDNRIRINTVVWSYHEEYTKELPASINVKINNKGITEKQIRIFFEFLYKNDISKLNGNNEDNLYYLLFAKEILMNDKILFSIAEKIKYDNDIIDLIVNKFELGHIIYNKLGYDREYIINNKIYKLHSKIIFEKSEFFKNMDKHKNIFISCDSNKINVVDFYDKEIDVEYIDLILEYLYGKNNILLKYLYGKKDVFHIESIEELYYVSNVFKFFDVKFDDIIIKKIIKCFNRCIMCENLKETINNITFKKELNGTICNIKYVRFFINKNDENYTNIKSIYTYSNGKISKKITYNNNTIKKTYDKSYCYEFESYVHNIINSILYYYDEKYVNYDKYKRDGIDANLYFAVQYMKLFKTKKN